MSAEEFLKEEFPSLNKSIHKLQITKVSIDCMEAYKDQVLKEICEEIDDKYSRMRIGGKIIKIIKKRIT